MIIAMATKHAAANQNNENSNDNPIQNKGNRAVINR